MRNVERLGFRQVWVLDFEFAQPDGECPAIICMVAKELVSGDLLRLWHPQLTRLSECPFPTDKNSLLVAYSAHAEWSCFLELGWSRPERILDLYLEHKALTNGRGLGGKLTEVCSRYGIPSIEAIDKYQYQQLCASGVPLQAGFARQEEILDYCQTDVDVTAKLLERMCPDIFSHQERARTTGSALSLYTDYQLAGQALFRGKYSWSLAMISKQGVPVDVALLEHAMSNWAGLRRRLIDELKANHGIDLYTEDYKFNMAKLETYVRQNQLRWPRTEKGQLRTDSRTMDSLVKVYPNEVEPIKAIFKDLGAMKLKDFTIGTDGRNRCYLNPFGSITGRNQPSNAKFIFFAAAWLRSFIVPPEGKALAYVDWSSQEVAIAAAQSDDPKMLASYKGGDVYLGFLKDAGLIPADATKKTHGEERNAAKEVVLGNQFGMGAETMADRMGKETHEARDLVNKYRETYSRYWRWSQRTSDTFFGGVSLGTALGWQIHPADRKPTTIMNWPMQSHGSDMLRLAVIQLHEAGIQINLTAHDAVLIESDEKDIDKAVAKTMKIMERASRTLLHDKVNVRTEAKVFRSGERFQEDKRGRKIWNMVMGILDRDGAKLTEEDDDISTKVG